MKTIFTFGFISGMATSVGFLPHILVLLLIVLSGINPNLVTPLIVFTVGAKAFGDWLFWSKLFADRMDGEKSLRNWRAFINNSLFAQPGVISSLLQVVIDSVVDVMLVYMALKTSVPPAWVFLAFVGCQAVAAPIQGAISDYSGRKKSLLFSTLITAFVIFTSMEINNVIAPGAYISFLGLSAFSFSTQMLIVLCAKSLLTGTTVVARAVIADCIQVETKGHFNEI